jgi:hypothetical protein
MQAVILCTGLEKNSLGDLLGQSQCREKVGQQKRCNCQKSNSVEKLIVNSLFSLSSSSVSDQTPGGWM